MIDEDLVTEETSATDMLLDLIELKNGKDTSEFVILVLNTLGMLVVSFGVITTEQLQQFTPIVLLLYLFVMFLGKVYIDWRGKLKTTNMQVNSTMQPLTIINNK